jgi:low temperature requirement protein LtrA
VPRPARTVSVGARHTRAMSIVPVVLRGPLVARDSTEHHRVATPLELLFDLVFVVAIASNAAQLHHGLSAAHLDTVLGYTLTWFAIWWAWMNYTWFASAYDNDDVGFRLLTFVIMTGALFLAAGVPDIFQDGQSVTVVVGYAIMRFGMVGLWLRAAGGHPERRRTALWYAAGIAVVQVLWIARLAIPAGSGWLLASFLALVAAELAVPLLAEARHGTTPFHPHHIAERYGLLTIIVLGEVILSAVQAIQGAMAGPPAEPASGGSGGSGGHSAPYAAPPAASGLSWSMAPLVVGGLLIVFALWWVYFSRDHGSIVEDPRSVWLFGYGHLPIFASTAAVGAALAAAVDVVQGTADAGPRLVALALAVAISVVALTVSGLHALGPTGTVATMVPAAVVSVLCLGVALLVPRMGVAVLLMGLTLAGLVAQRVCAAGRSLPASPGRAAGEAGA